MHPADFEPAILAIERPQTYALDSTVTGIGFFFVFTAHLTVRSMRKVA
jgi:hypothetical protein